MLDKHLLSFKIIFRCLQEIWSGSGVDELLHFLIAFLNFFFEKEGYYNTDFVGISFKKLRLIWWSWTELNVWWRTCYKSTSSIHSCLLYWKTLMADNLCFLTHSWSSMIFCFLTQFFVFFLSKKMDLVFLIDPLKLFQSSIDLED